MKKLTRKEMLKGCLRGSLLAGIGVLCGVLVSREEKFECSNQCGQCSKWMGGTCGLDLK